MFFLKKLNMEYFLAKDSFLNETSVTMRHSGESNGRWRRSGTARSNRRGHFKTCFISKERTKISCPKMWLHNGEAETVRVGRGLTEHLDP